jgi:transposase-like protein
MGEIMNTQGISKPPYEESFKDQAVELLIESGRPLKVVARELGVSDTTLRDWKRRYLERMGTPAGGAQKITPQTLEEENRRLRQENEYLRRQRDILKKACGILSETPPRGMP